MKASTAAKLVNKYEEPQTLKDILNQIKMMSKCGLMNTSIMFNNEMTVKTIEKKLAKLGYNVDYSHWEYDEFLLEVQW